MSANVQPIYSKASNIGFVNQITAASTDHLGGSAVVLFTAGTLGSFLSQVVATPLGTNVASVLRCWVNNGATFATTTNNALLFEVSLPATTITEVAAQSSITVVLNFALPATYRLGIAIGTAVAAGWAVVCEGGNY